MADEKGKILKLLKLHKLFENLTGYMEVQIEIVKLDLKDQAEKTSLNIIQAVIILMLMVIFLLLISLVASIAINYYTNSNFIGYIIVSLLYLVLVVILAIDKKKRFANWIFKKFNN